MGLMLSKSPRHIYFFKTIVPPPSSRYTGSIGGESYDSLATIYLSQHSLGQPESSGLATCTAATYLVVARVLGIEHLNVDASRPELW